MRRVLALAIAAGAVLGFRFAQDPADASVRTKSAVEKIRGQKSYTVTFEAVVRVPESDPLKITGETVWITPGILFTQYTASGGEKVRIVRVGEKVWWYHMVGEDWYPAEEIGKPAAGRGVQNPDEVLGAVLKASDKAVLASKATVAGKPADLVEMKLDGASLQKIMKSQAATGSIDWTASSGTVKLTIGSEDGLIHQMEVAAEVASTDPALKGKKINYTADVKLTANNRDFSMEFSDFDLKAKKKIPIPLPAPFLDEVEKQKGIPDELKALIPRLRGK